MLPQPFSPQANHVFQTAQLGEAIILPGGRRVIGQTCPRFFRAPFAVVHQGLSVRERYREAGFGEGGVLVDGAGVGLVVPLPVVCDDVVLLLAVCELRLAA